MSKRWTVTPGRTLCFDNREIFNVVRVTEPNIEIDPAALDDLTHAICGHLNNSGATVKQPFHARFCQLCGDRNMNPGQACASCGHAIMGPAFKSARVKP